MPDCFILQFFIESFWLRPLLQNTYWRFCMLAISIIFKTVTIGPGGREGLMAVGGDIILR
jgi:hypothetical protein